MRQINTKIYDIAGITNRKSHREIDINQLVTDSYMDEVKLQKKIDENTSQEAKQILEETYKEKYGSKRVSIKPTSIKEQKPIVQERRASASTPTLELEKPMAKPRASMPKKVVPNNKKTVHKKENTKEKKSGSFGRLILLLILGLALVVYFKPDLLEVIFNSFL